MKLGIEDRWAVVCASSRGLGKACASALAGEGVNVVINGRDKRTLMATAAELRAIPGAAVVHAIVADVTIPEGRQRLLAAAPVVDILVTNAGGPPPGDFRHWNQDDWFRALNANMLTPIELIKATIDAMMARGFGRIVNITSSSVKAPIEILGLSNGARSGLTGFVAGLARKTVQHGVTINNMLPGAFDTDRLAGTQRTTAEMTGTAIDDVRERQKHAIPARRFGEPGEFGKLCAFLCSIHAGYVTGQNILIDGGAYPGTF